jgi:hypothetical protein
MPMMMLVAQQPPVGLSGHPDAPKPYFPNGKYSDQRNLLVPFINTCSQQWNGLRSPLERPSLKVKCFDSKRDCFDSVCLSRSNKVHSGVTGAWPLLAGE